MAVTSNRREFIQQLGIGSLPFLVPGLAGASIPHGTTYDEATSVHSAGIHFITDGLRLFPKDYIAILQTIEEKKPIASDFYLSGGVTRELENRFAELTGKEKAIFLPTGTMANQLAIALLSGNNTKVLVPENSHTFRDEADAAQSVHGKRLVPVITDGDYYTATQVEETISHYEKNEVFRSGLGALLVEHPIRRANGLAVPLKDLEEISLYCSAHGIKTHLDGARLHIASAYTGIPVRTYCNLFDTVYISLYKYLNAPGGAMLCGNAELIEAIPHLIKIHGGTLFHGWMFTAIADHYLDHLDERLKEVADRSETLRSKMNAIPGVQLKKIPNGTNIFLLQLDASLDPKKMIAHLRDAHQITLRPPDENGTIHFVFNESILTQDDSFIINAMEEAIDVASK